MKYRNNKNKRGFTLIELIAVLVIMAIIALIVTPLVMNIVKKAKDSANKRSIDAYGKSVELAVATYLLDTGDYPTSLDNLKVEYTGTEVVCNVKILNKDGSIYLTECRVKGTDAKDNNTEDGWYHYGKTTELTSEEPVSYETYAIGDTVTYNGMEFYVIEDSDERDDRVTMLKAEPLTYKEIRNYSEGTGALTMDNNGYGGMQYGATRDYETSYVKVVVETWTGDKLKTLDLAEDSLGYKTRLLTLEDLTNNLGYVIDDSATHVVLNTENTPSWAYNSSYNYWTMSLYKEDFTSDVWDVDSSGYVGNSFVDSHHSSVRPVVTILKSAI